MGALGGMADAGLSMMQDQRKADELEKQRKAEDERERQRMILNDQLAKERAKELAVHQSELEISGIGRKATATAQAAKDNAGLIGEANLAKFEAEAPVRRQQASEALDHARGLSQIELEKAVSLANEKTKQMNDPAYLSGVKKETEARRDHSGDALRSLQTEAAKIALEEKKAEVVMPYANRQAAESLKEQIKKKGEIIDKATVDGSATPEGIAKLEADKAAMSKKLGEMYKPFMKNVDGEKTESTTLEFTNQSDALAAVKAGKVKSGDKVIVGGKIAIWQDDPKTEHKTDTKTPEEKKAPSIKEGDTRQVALGRGLGYKTQVYKKSGRGGLNLEWMDQ